MRSSFLTASTVPIRWPSRPRCHFQGLCRVPTRIALPAPSRGKKSGPGILWHWVLHAGVRLVVVVFICDPHSLWSFGEWAGPVLRRMLRLDGAVISGYRGMTCWAEEGKEEGEKMGLMLWVRSLGLNWLIAQGQSCFQASARGASRKDRWRQSVTSRMRLSTRVEFCTLEVVYSLCREVPNYSARERRKRTWKQGEKTVYGKVQTLVIRSNHRPLVEGSFFQGNGPALLPKLDEKKPVGTNGLGILCGLAAVGAASAFSSASMVGAGGPLVI